MNQRNPVQTFLLEAEDLLTRIEEIALELRPHQEIGETINQLFRAFHTLKGSGAMFGFASVAGFTHHVETVLDRVREGQLSVSEELIHLILHSKDQIKALLDAAQNQTDAPLAAGDEIVAALNLLLPESSVAPQSSVPTASATSRQSNENSAAEKTYRICFRPDPGLMISGTNPIALLNELRDLGECEITASIESVPALDQLQPDHCHLVWNVRLTTNRDANAINDVFIFVQDGSEIRIEAEENSEAPITSNEAEIASASPIEPVQTAKAHPSIPTSTKESTATSFARKPGAKDSTIRVASERLDRLVNLVGELVMNQSRLTQVAARANVPNLSGPVEELERLVAELRDNVLGIRMMPIGTTFSRFKRLVHDLSRDLGKEVDLVTEGEETEMDKTVLDQLADPLVHLIRNSLDHGIESPDARLSAGKSRNGTIRLNASHEGAQVVITIQDDGRGLNKTAILSKAVEKNLIKPDAQLSESEIYNLIFLPGFSTAREVSSISGRGVGMDAAKRTIESLRGTITLASSPGHGTTIRLTLPLTLAIIDGLLVEIQNEHFIIPMASVLENVELTRAERGSHNGRNVVPVRGELIPYLRLRDLFEIRGEEFDIEKIVIVALNGERLGLVVDRVVGSHQTVIQPMGRFCRSVGLFSGTTIMGDGHVAMILDLPGVVRHAERPPVFKSQSQPAQSAIY